MKSFALAAAIGLAVSGAAAAPNGFGTVNGVSYEQVRFYTPGSLQFPTQSGSVVTDRCAGADICGEPMTFASAYGGTFTVTAVDNTNDPGIVSQDLSANSGGLGVVSWGANGVYGEDGINSGETLTLSFAKAVTIVGMHFFDTDHTTAESVDRGTLKVLNGATTVFDGSIGLQSYVTSNTAHWYTGTSFTFGYGFDNDTPKGYYLGAVKLMQPVPAIPEPGTTALMMAGLAALGFVARRRRYPR